MGVSSNSIKIIIYIISYYKAGCGVEFRHTIRNTSKYREQFPLPSPAMCGKKYKVSVQTKRGVVSRHSTCNIFHIEVTNTNISTLDSIMQVKYIAAIIYKRRNCKKLLPCTKYILHLHISDKCYCFIFFTVLLFGLSFLSFLLHYH